MADILLTNDDGIDAAGLKALEAALEPVGRVTVVAPASERSGAAQSITLRQPILCAPAGPRRWKIEGTPADAVLLALLRLMERPPALVVSGVNLGANVGENVHYSGTVGAAMEAALHGLPALAVSLASREPGDGLEAAARLGALLARLLLEEPLPAGILLNLNVPRQWSGRVRFVRQSRRITRSVLREEDDPRGRLYWLHEVRLEHQPEPATDWEALLAGDAALTPLSIDRTHEASLNHLSHLAERVTGLLGRG